MSEEKWNNIYCTFGLNLPWCLEEIPDWFKDLVESKWVSPSRALDMGCGVGEHACYLAKKGFNVIAIDISEKAISLAKERCPGDNPIFITHDIFELDKLGKTFDFVYEISILHNINPADRILYVKKVGSVLETGGKFMVCCFSKDDPIFEGKEELYVPEFNNTMYPLTEVDLRSLFSKDFLIEKIQKVYFGRKGQRQRERLLCLMTKR